MIKKQGNMYKKEKCMMKKKLWFIKKTNIKKNNNAIECFFI